VNIRNRCKDTHLFLTLHFFILVVAGLLNDTASRNLLILIYGIRNDDEFQAMCESPSKYSQWERDYTRSSSRKEQIQELFGSPTKIPTMDRISIVPYSSSIIKPSSRLGGISCNRRNTLHS
jgi:hypothetical protein